MITVEKFKEHLAMIEQRERQSLEQDRSIIAKLFLWKGDHLAICGIVQDEGGPRMGEIIQKLIRVQGGDCFIFVSEGWSIHHDDRRTKEEMLQIGREHRVHEQPDRREALIVHAAHRDFTDSSFQFFHRADGTEEGPIVWDEKVGGPITGEITNAARLLGRYEE